MVIVSFFILRSILHKETKYYDSRSGQQINVLASFYKSTVFLETIKARYNYVFSPTPGGVRHEIRPIRMRHL